MPVVGSPTTYATVAEARTFGITTAQASDASLQSLLEVASVIVDNYTGRTFTAAAASTYIAYDVRTDVVALPTPFANVTSVVVNDGAAIDAQGYAVTRWGLYLTRPGIKDADGFVRGGSFAYQWFKGRGNKVAVTATFGSPSVPAPVREAVLHVVLTLLERRSFRPDSTVDAEGNPSTLPTAAFVTGVSGDEVEGDEYTTGSVEADRLLEAYKRVQVL